jgi:hypothetical protein
MQMMIADVLDPVITPIPLIEVVIASAMGEICDFSSSYHYSCCKCAYFSSQEEV